MHLTDSLTKSASIHTIKINIIQYNLIKPIIYNNNIRIKDKFIRLPKVGWIRYRTQQKITGQIQSVTVKQKASGKYLISILCKNVTRHIYKTNNRSCGIDLGVSRFDTINTGKIIQFPTTKQNHTTKQQNTKITKKTIPKKNLAAKTTIKSKRK